jgi:hypothetical protein
MPLPSGLGVLSGRNIWLFIWLCKAENFFTCGGLCATAGFLLSADKRNKNSWRLFYFADFLRLAASATEPLALQARLDGLLYSALSLRSS